MTERRPPVFLDPQGIRRRRLRQAALLVGVITTIIALIIVVGIATPPLLPDIVKGLRPTRDLRAAPTVPLDRNARQRFAARRKLIEAYSRRGRVDVPSAIRPARIPALRNTPLPGKTPTTSQLTVGFFVNWDDNSFESFRLHAAQMDWVVCEWGFVQPGGDSIRLAIEHVNNPNGNAKKLLAHVKYMADSSADAPPRVLLMITNIDTITHHFDAARLRSLVSVPANRDRAIGQILKTVTSYGLYGVTLDFEEFPDDLIPGATAFAHQLGVALHSLPGHHVITQAVSNEATPEQVRRYGAVNDALFFMLYDEHFASSDPGPVASHAWYLQRAQRMLSAVPPSKAILAIGAYGYDWNDASTTISADAMTFQETMRAVRESGAKVEFDTVSLNPYAAWQEPDSTDHLVWFLDGVTAYNQIHLGEQLGVEGHAVWRLGAEDPSLWGALGRKAKHPPQVALQTIGTGYDPEFDGNGEILHLLARPDSGRRVLRLDRSSGLVTWQRYDSLPTHYLISRSGAVPHRVALTFDDGPDGRWTPKILDTLRSRRAPATFFVIGRNVERNILLTRRIYREGHLIGNHTFTHPNLWYVPPFMVKLELDATERLLEAILNRRTAFFRPPYFGDAEPTTPDELVPVGIADNLGYITVGLHVDSEDWLQPDGISARAIVDTTLSQIEWRRVRNQSANVILLHDGGGPRPYTVAALGTLIDSLRARGDTIVPLSELAGIPVAAAMPPLPTRSAVLRALELGAFGSLGLVEIITHWLFVAAVVLGIGRLVVIIVLAAMHRFGKDRRPGDRRYTPSVSIIVPAYNESKVIGATLDSLLTQDYAGPLEVIVVDDGSPDDTYDVITAEFGDEPRVRAFRKANGGKASALNFGIAHATGEIVVCLDADTIFVPDTVAALVAPLADPEVGAVAGNAKVGNRINLVTRWQALEYVTSQNLDRRAFSLLNCITVVPGAVGAWRADLVREVGGFTEDTLAEDQDLTLAIRKRGSAIAYADNAYGYTEAPDTLRALARQRFRWSFGTLQCAWKHRDALFRPKYGLLGFVALPNVWLFQLFFTALSPLADLLFVWSLISVWLTRLQHGGEFSRTDLEQLLAYYAVFLLVDWAAAMVAFLMEPREQRSLTWLIFLQRFAYRQVMYWVVVKSFIAAVQGHVVGWGKLERKATVSLDVEPSGRLVVYRTGRAAMFVVLAAITSIAVLALVALGLMYGRVL